MGTGDKKKIFPLWKLLNLQFKQRIFTIAIALIYHLVNPAIGFHLYLQGVFENYLCLVSEVLEYNVWDTEMFIVNGFEVEKVEEHEEFEI